MGEMDVILPVLNMVQNDGTLYLKEYMLNSGQCKGLRVACELNSTLFQ